ncbi:hypothetical protein NIES4101_62880 [Calothrix sp. NIES-4101]|nr:hypothetical protein NIES4101_62880 [Calothrix sp. NIES-4101]
MTSRTSKNMYFKPWGLLTISLIIPGMAIALISNSVRAEEQNPSPQADLVVGQVLVQGGDVGIPDDTTSIKVQWNVGNQGQGTSQGFKDKLQVFFVGKESNACPGSIPPSGQVVAESEVDESLIAPGEAGQNQEVTVGPFEEGSYLFYVTANSDGGEANEAKTDNNSNFNCIYIKHS